MTATTNRETWLNSLAAMMAPRFAELGFPLPLFRVSIGFTSGGKGSKADGECWSSKCSADGHFEIFIRADQAETEKVAAILAHELTHPAVGFDQGHRGNFAKVVGALGMVRPFTSSVAGPGFLEWIAPMLAELGPVPHARLNWNGPGGVRLKPWKDDAPGRDAGDDQDGEGGDDAEGMTTGPKKQTTRLRKAACNECGYAVRVTSKWLEVGMPHCPNHGAMQVDDGAGE